MCESFTNYLYFTLKIKKTELTSITSKQVILLLHILYIMLLFQVNIFICILNFLYDYLILCA